MRITLKFTELKRFLKDNTLNNYLLLGNDDFLLEKSYELIFESKSFDPVELNVLQFKENVDAEEVVKALNTLPMFSEYKLVYVDLAGNLSNEKVLVEYLKQPNQTSILVINAREDKKKAKAFMANCELVDCNKLDEKTVYLFVKSELQKQQKQIEQDALTTLCEFCLFHLTSINAEVQKLVAYIGTNTTIVKQDVLKMVTKSLDYQVFDLTDALAKRDAKRVYALLQDMSAKRENEKMLLPLISNHFRRLFHARLNADNKQVAELLGVKEYAVVMARKQVKLFTAKQLKQIVDLCLQLDFEVKTGVMQTQNAVQFLILNILNINSLS